MIDYLSVLEALSGEMETVLAVPNVKGFPVFARTEVTDALSALQFVGVEPGRASAIGRPLAQDTTLWTLFLIATNEIELVGMIARLVEWFKTTPVLVIDGQRVPVLFSRADRLSATDDVIAKDYIFAFTLAVTK